MIVVIDNDALQNLILTRNTELLNKIFDRVYIPSQVLQEARQVTDPKLQEIPRWVNNLPDWAMERSVTIDPSLSATKYGMGERAAITLSEQLKKEQLQPVVLVMDDKKAKQEARENRNLAVIGTLGLAQEGYHRGYMSYSRTVDDLVVHTKAHLDEKVIEHAQRHFESGIRPLGPDKLLVDRDLPLDPFTSGFKGYECVNREKLGISDKLPAKEVVEIAALQGVKAIVTRDPEIEEAAIKRPNPPTCVMLQGPNSSNRYVLETAMNDIVKIMQSRTPEAKVDYEKLPLPPI